VNDPDGKEFVRHAIGCRFFALFTDVNVRASSSVPLATLFGAILKDIPSVEFDKSVLDPGTKFDPVIPLHLLAFMYAQRDFVTVCREVCEDMDFMFMRWALLPLRFHFACELSHIGLFVRNTSSLLIVMQFVKDRSNYAHRFAPTFALIQTLRFDIPQKEEFLRMIASVSGVFSDFSETTTKERHFILFSFLHFVCCLIYDRTIMANDEAAVRRLAIMTQLIISAQKPAELEMLWEVHALNDESFLEDLSTFAERVSTATGSQFRITDDSKWHPLIPMAKLSQILEVMSKLASKHPNSIVNFPKLLPKLASLLLSPLLFAVEFHILADPELDKEAAQLVFNLLIHASEQSDKREISRDYVVASSVLDLVDRKSVV
jgi:hypothetical protein